MSPRGVVEILPTHGDYVRTKGKVLLQNTETTVVRTHFTNYFESSTCPIQTKNNCFPRQKDKKNKIEGPRVHNMTGRPLLDQKECEIIIVEVDPNTN